MGGRLRALDGGQKLIRATAPNPGGAFRALRQHFAERPFNLDDGIQRGQHGIGAAKLQLDAIGLLPGDNALFITFHGKGNGPAASHGIHTVLIADLAGARNGIQITDPATGTQ